MAQNPFGEVPFFRELQRLLSSSEGPVNYELARQVAGAIASTGAAPADSVDQKAYTQAVRELEVLASGYTRLAPPEPLEVTVLDRAGWIAATFTGWRWVIDRMAERLSSQLGPGQLDDPAGAAMGGAMAQVSPLLFGIQAGTLVGTLSTRAMGRYDIPIPRDDDGALFFVAPNISRFAIDYGLDEDLKRWFALGQIVPHLVVRTVPWLGPLWKSLVVEVVDAIEIDIDDLQRKLMELQSGGLEGIDAGQPDILPLTPSPRHQAALARVRALEALLDGYARHTTEAVSGEVIGDTGRFAESLARFHATGDEAEALLGKILGVVTDRTTKIAGANFCAAVVKLRGIAALNKVWDAPDNLPTIDEIKDPFAWMERILDVDA